MHRGLSIPLIGRHHFGKEHDGKNDHSPASAENRSLEARTSSQKYVAVYGVLQTPNKSIDSAFWQ